MIVCPPSAEVRTGARRHQSRQRCDRHQRPGGPGDFGLFRITRHVTGIPSGTPGDRAPERLRGGSTGRLRLLRLRRALAYHVLSGDQPTRTCRVGRWPAPGFADAAAGRWRGARSDRQEEPS